jgi:DNA-directed RNA polymerase
MYLDREFNKMFQEESLNVAMDIIAEFDGIFYDIVKSVKRMEDGQFATFTYIRSEILFSENLNLRATYNRFRLPLIECPDDWTEKSRGGYKLTKRKCTTGRGSEKQPQLVLDALNKLQKQSWIHSQDEELELNYSYDKFLSEGNSDRMSRKKANDLLLSTEETYATMEEIPMHFEYRFDFRGRIYSTGYDINPQGNTIKKGGLIPNFE